MTKKRGPINPYLVGPPVTGEYGFYGRQNLVESVVNTLTNARQNAIVLHGQRRIGKSSLLYRLRRDDTLRQDHFPIFLDMQLYEGFPPARILANLAQTISDELGLSLPLPTEADLSPSYDQFHRTFLPQVYQQLDHKRIVILIDEFDVVVPTMTETASANTLLGYLRTLIAENQEHLAFVFVVGQRLDLLGEGYRRLFKGTHAQPVGRLGQDETYNLLTELGEKGEIYYTDEALAEVWALTNGHPYLTQLIGFEIFERLQKQGVQPATAEDVTACRSSAMERGQGALDWFWRGFEPEQQWVLSAVADLTDRQQSVSDTEINKTLEQYLLIMTPLARDKAYRHLLQGDFLVQTDKQQYQFAIEFIRQWIVKHHPLQEIQRQIEEISPEALNYYQLGLHAFGRGNLAQAIENYRLALEHNPYFARAHLDMAVALRAQGNISEAIDEYEEAYQLDPNSAREELIDLRLIHARQLESEDNHEETLVQAWRILDLDSKHSETRQMVSSIYLSRANEHLARKEFAAALALAKQLAEPVPIIQDEDVGHQVRELWLAYSYKLINQEPPRWDEAQIVLDSLNLLGLLDENVRTTYNQVTLDKAQAFLNNEKLDLALATLSNELRSPLPDEAIKNMLLDYNREQIEARQWTQADQVLGGLRRLVDDQDSQVAQSELYEVWGNALLKAKKFDEAITIFRRGETPDFKSHITRGYLDKGGWHLAKHQLADAQESYQQALATQNKKAIRQEIHHILSAYLDERRKEQVWPHANGALKILFDLNLAGDTGASLETDLQLDQAEAELGQGLLDEAFERLAKLGRETREPIKNLIRTYIQLKANRKEWKTGEITLEHLRNLFSDDQETTAWYANWLFMWAKALFPADSLDRNPVQAKALCQKVLEFAPHETPLLDLLSNSEKPEMIDAAGLHRQVCTLSAAVALDQGQACLDHDDLTQAQALFAEALSLPLPPEDLQKRIQAKLQTFSRHQILKERWAQAQQALVAAIELGVGDSEISQDLTTLPTSQARLSLKADEPAEAFSILSREGTEFTAEEHETIKTMVYQFSRLYAGRNHWDEAKETLEHLRDWLVPAPEKEEVMHWLDDLNFERLNFIRGRRLPTPVAEVEVHRLEDEIEVAEGGYRDARRFELDTLDDWAENFIQAGLTLGYSFLANEDLTTAIHVYKKILEVESRRTNHKDQIGQSLHNHSERMLDQEKWVEARQSVEELKSFNLMAPDGRTRPDPRVDGSIQRVLLAQSQAWLAEDQVAETFELLKKLPRPRPTGAVKEIIRVDTEKRLTGRDWSNAITALRSLDKFLEEDRQDREDRPQARDQQALQWLVDGLEQWGHYLEDTGDLAEAAEAYYEGLIYTREAATPRSVELAGHYMHMAFQLAQNCLDEDALGPEIPPAMTEAVAWHQKILALEEHEPEQENRINDSLNRHAQKLAKAQQWRRAYQALDNLEGLYPEPKDEFRTQFALWRRDLAFDEVRAHLATQDLNPAFAALEVLKGWLEERTPPQAGWPEAEAQVKVLVYDDFCQPWLQSRDWDVVEQALERLVDLIPDDREIIGWIVDALYRRGQWERDRDRLKDALTRFKQALERTPQQDTVSGDQIETALLETQLAYAQQYLDRHEFIEARSIYEQILKKPPEYLDRAGQIRSALKNYSDLLTEQTPPKWGAAHQAVDCLLELGLNNEQVFEWRQKLTLRELKSMLQRNKLDAAFISLAALEQPWPIDNIKTIVHEYSHARARTETWQLAIDALQRLGETVDTDTGVQQWIADELVVLGDQFDTQENLAGAQAAYELAMSFNRSESLDPEPST